MRLLIAGSRGFVGSSVGHLASLSGHDVLGLGLSTQPVKGWKGRYLQANVATSDLSGILRDFKPDVLLHAAGGASVGMSLAFPLDDLKAAALTWANMLEGVRRSGLKPLILFPSSAAVYGNPPSLPVREDAPTQPISPYGFHKAICELLAREYTECFDLRIVVCRLFSVFGPAQKRLLIWELFEQLSAAGQTTWLQGTGEESRDYLYIDDVASALLELSENLLRSTDRIGCRFVNVASGIETRVVDLAKGVRDLVAAEKEIECRGQVRPGDPRAWRADIEVLRSLAPSWHPAPLTERLTECIAIWKEEGK